ncbi:MAG: hypothetical protein KC420_18855 [Myxococcales bacterium]|nr:hypothetical protein [Myxococcales bacterium]MCB9568188.1 hypothetical protein [Myxococcales bacterium]MCB9705410.1 hypothetical protein [Myxococcales bacterium]
MSAYTEPELAALIAGFCDRTLPIEAWTHQAHVAAAAWHLDEHGSADAALCLMRSRIIVYNALRGPGNRIDGGYHETLTLFWIGAVAHHRAALDPTLPLVTRIDALLAGPPGRAGYPRDFYSPALLESVAARARWLPPDRAPLPWAWPG